MAKRIALTTSLSVLLVSQVSVTAVRAAQERTSQGSSKIQAFDTSDAAKPAEATSAPTPTPQPPSPRVAANVMYGAVIPPPPRVEVASTTPSRIRPYDGRRSASGGFVARAAAATRFAVNSPFGVRSDPITGVVRMHTGVDLRASFGESVGSSMSGTVWFAGERSGYGNLVVVDHGQGIATFYAHLSKIVVSAGDPVEAGQLLGYVGSTGHSTGPHLHYEVRANGRAVDPSSSLALSGDQLIVNGQSVGVASASGPVALPKAPGGTNIATDWKDEDTLSVGGKTLSVDWE